MISPKNSTQHSTFLQCFQTSTVDLVMQGVMPVKTLHQKRTCVRVRTITIRKITYNYVYVRLRKAFTLSQTTGHCGFLA